MAHLTVWGPEGPEHVALDQENTVGRHPSSRIRLADAIVSKEHCTILKEGSDFVLEDKGSLNGTFINGERVTRKNLKAGDEIVLGSTRLTFHDGSQPPPCPQRADAYFDDQARVTEPVVQTQDPNKVTIADDGVESYIRSKVHAAPDNFLPEQNVSDSSALRADYEKLRVSYEVSRAIGSELDMPELMVRILRCAFHLLDAERGVIMLLDEQGMLKPAHAQTRNATETPENLVLSSTILDQVLREKVGVLSSDATVDVRFQTAKSVIMQGIRSAMAVPLLCGNEVLGVLWLDSHVASNAFTSKDLELFQTVANQAAIAIQNSLYAKKIERAAVARQRFEKLLSPAIARQVFEGQVEIQKGGELRRTTVLFADIRGYTTLSQKLKAQELVDVLNGYFERMVEVIFKHEGTLDKFVGDAVMALFGAPVSHADDPERAIQTALDMLDTLKLFNDDNAHRLDAPLSIGIGINTGDVVAGYFGNSRALEYTVVGDPVNIGSRLCSIARPSEILISEETYKLVQHRYAVEEREPVLLKGRSQPSRVLRVLSRIPASTMASQRGNSI